MSRALFDCTRMFTKHLFGFKKSTLRPRQSVWPQLTLESLEERNLLSASATEPIAPSPQMEAGHYAIQEVMYNVSSYESTVASVQRIVANLEQQSLLAVSRVESAVDLMLEELIQQTLFPTSTESSPSGQSTTMASGQPGDQKPIDECSQRRAGC